MKTLGVVWIPHFCVEFTAAELKLLRSVRIGAIDSITDRKHKGCIQLERRDVEILLLECEKHALDAHSSIGISNWQALQDTLRRLQSTPDLESSRS